MVRKLSRSCAGFGMGNMPVSAIVQSWSCSKARQVALSACMIRGKLKDHICFSWACTAFFKKSICIPSLVFRIAVCRVCVS